ncbi:MAG: hypothetical protein IJC18_01075 [Clostridia bacterium]|nr:hypothetical protein [Clostridia bacterium]
MVSRKYANEYRLQNVTDSRGKIKTVPVYYGDYYVFEADRQDMLLTRNTYLVATVAIWLMLGTALCMDSYSTRVLYVVLPAAICVLPLFYLSLAVWDILFGIDKRMIHEKADLISSRTAACPLFLAVFSGMSFIGYIPSLFSNKDILILPADILFGIAMLAVAAISVLLYLRRGALSMKIVQNENVFTEESASPEEEDEASSAR